MRLRRLEIVIIGLTLAFVCFLGGYFTGLKTAVNIVPVVSQNGDSLQGGRSGEQGSGAAVANPGTDTSENTITEPPDAMPPDTGTGQPKSSVGMPRDSDGRININLASRSELMDLPGIGSVLAERIVEYRRVHGLFKGIEEIRKVSGIGEKRFEAIRDRITVGG